MICPDDPDPEKRTVEGKKHHEDQVYNILGIQSPHLISQELLGHNMFWYQHTSYVFAVSDE